MSIKIISRGKGKSAVAAAAYRSGENIINKYDGITHDYTRKGGIAHTEILLPENAPPEYSDRATLWNAVEKIEKNRNSQLAREIELALPVELSEEQNIELVRTYCQQHFVDAGMCAYICIHDKKDGNPHAHIMLTIRPLNEKKVWGNKQKKNILLTEMEIKSTIKRNVLTNANLFPLLAGTSRAKPKNGAPPGLILSINIWRMQMLPNVLTIAHMSGRVLRKYQPSI